MIQGYHSFRQVNDEGQGKQSRELDYLLRGRGLRPLVLVGGRSRGMCRVLDAGRSRIRFVDELEQEVYGKYLEL